MAASNREAALRQRRMAMRGLGRCARRRSLSRKRFSALVRFYRSTRRSDTSEAGGQADIANVPRLTHCRTPCCIAQAIGRPER